MISSTDYYPFTAVVGQNRLKKLLSILAVEPNLGVILIQGPDGTMKNRLTLAMCKLTDALSDSKQRSYQVIPTYEIDELSTYANDISTEYIVIPSYQLLNGSIRDRLLRSWASRNHGEISSMILLENGTTDRPDKKIDFYTVVEPITDVERRIETVKREREYRMDNEKFCFRFKDTESTLSQRVFNARKILSEVNVTETLKTELMEELKKRTNTDHMENTYKKVIRFACADAAFNNRRWVSREDIESALNYINY